MPALRTIAKPPFGDSVSVNIPEEYRTCTLEIIVLPAAVSDSGEYKCFDSVGTCRQGDADAKVRANQELLELAGTWEDDPETDKVLAEMRQIDWAIWK